MSPTLLVLVLACAFCCVSLGGGLYEFSVLDPAWPKRLDLVRPSQGGVSRKRFWIPAHTVFELTLVIALVMSWSEPDVRRFLLLGLATHAAMRIWSAFDFIPKALAFERSDLAGLSEKQARAWTARSVLRLPLDLITCGSMFAALLASR